MINLGIGIPFRRMGAGIDAQAQAHYDRVIADGGLIPSGLNGVNNFFTTVKAIYGTSDITTAISVGLDAQVLGYKLGAGVGTTAGQAAQKLYSCSGASGDVEQTTFAASQPLLLVHSGANYYYSGATSGNYVSTPDSVNATFSGDIDLKVRIVNFVNNQVQVYASKRGASGFVFYSDTSGLLNLEPWSVASSASVANGFNGWLRITKTSTEIKFYTGTDSEIPTFTQLGATITGSFSNPGANTDIFGIGGIYNTSTLSYFPAYCKILRVTKANSVDGAPVVDFNPNQYNAANSQTQWVSTSGETWTINTGTASTGYKGVLVDRTIVQGDGIDDVMTQSSNILLFINATNYAAFRIFETSAANKSVVSLGNNPNEIDHKQNNNTIQAASMFAPALNLRFAAMQRNETGLQGVANVNNGATITNTITASGTNLNKVYLFATPYIQCGNGIVNTEIVTPNLDNSTTRTAIYNYVRSINNNAF